MSETFKKRNTLIIDGYGFVFRAYHSMPPLTAPDGTPVGAVYGFISMLIKVLQDFKPTHAVVVLDSGSKNFRHDIYPEYKANRPPAPEDLKPQFPLIREAAKALSFKVVEKIGFEADDLIATFAKKAREHEEKVTIISADKDLMQLVGDDINMYDSLKNKFIDTNAVIEKFAVKPSQILDFLALIGDKSDNIPGIDGIGPKTAAELLNNYGDLDSIFINAEQIKQKKRRESIINGRDKAILSKQLAKLDEDVEIEIDFNELTVGNINMQILQPFLENYGFKSHLTRVIKLFDIDYEDLQQQAPAKVLNNEKISIIKNKTELLELIELIKKEALIAFSLIEFKDELFAFNICLTEANYIIYLENDDIQNDLFAQADKLELTSILNILASIFEDLAIEKLFFNIKPLLHLYKSQHLERNFQACHDLLLMHYSYSAGTNQITLQQIADKLLGFQLTTLEDFAKNNRSIKKYNDLPETELLKIISHNARALYQLYPVIRQNMLNNKSCDLYYNQDLPLSFCLAEVEHNGIKLDVDYLTKLRLKLTEDINNIEQKIYNLAGEEFNIGSPKQLGEILFAKLKLPGGKISKKSGAYVTNVEILENLQADNHQIADYLLEWRQLNKLQTTYTEALTKQADNNHRLHTNFLQYSTSTSRLSSQNPNLQNIPIRTEIGNKIRKAFITEDAHDLISADYSQIELRILSEAANISELKQAFKENKDIHSETAMHIFNIDNVTADIRRKAKAINFGIIYGLSAFGLAKQLNISRAEAQAHIEEYFNKFPGIKEYMEITKEFAKKHGYVKNLFGRRCYIPTINDKNYALRSFGERAAINAPLQGTSADITKKAMLAVNKALKEHNFKTRMLLQVHDELLFESPKNETEQVMPIIKKAMQNVANLSIPLLVDIKAGKNWQEIH